MMRSRKRLYVSFAEAFSEEDALAPDPTPNVRMEIVAKSDVPARATRPASLNISLGRNQVSRNEEAPLTC